MQAKIFGGLFGLLWGGICYEAGRISQREQKEDFSSTKVEIYHPELKGVATSSYNVAITESKTQDTFVDGLIEPPFRQVNYPHFKILYSTYHKCPLAVHYKFTKELAEGDAPRRSTFFTYKMLDEQFQSTNDHFIKSGAYKNFGFTRGHMAAAGNYSGNKEAKFMTFTYANVIPQDKYNNGGIWNTFERYSRELLTSGKCDSVEVISGPIYFKNGQYLGENGEMYEKVYQYKSIVLGYNGIIAPYKLYKIIKCNTKSGEQYLDAFEFWNKKTFDNDRPLKEFMTSVKSVYNQTGLKFNFVSSSAEKPTILKSLVEYDREGFYKVKKVYDYKFFFKLISDAKTIDDMNNVLFRAKDQHIHVPLYQFGDKTEKLFKQDMYTIRANYDQNRYKVACNTLNKLLKLNKNLYYLRQMNPSYGQEIEKLYNSGSLEQCYQKANLLRSASWDYLSSDDYASSKQKQEKISLNSLTYAITKSLNKQQYIAKSTAAPVYEVKDKIFVFANEYNLKKFIIPVNISVSLAEEKAKTSS